MTDETAASNLWSKSRWLATIVVVMAGQVGFIFWLARHGQTAPPSLTKAPTVYLATKGGINRPDVIEPALFVLPNRLGFSGGAWMKTSPLTYEPIEWTEPPRPLALATEKLGSALNEFARTNLSETFELASKPEPLLDLAPPPPDLGPTHSTLTIEGELAHRPLASKFKLDSWPAPDVLNDSVVQLAVDSEGAVFSAVLINEPGELKEAKAADAYALNLARTARFQALPRNDARAGTTALQWGRLVFHWHTVPPPVTNSTAANP